MFAFITNSLAQQAPPFWFSRIRLARLSQCGMPRSRIRKQFRVFRYDTRGHGQSSVTPGPYSIEQLAGDVLALLDHLNLDRVHFCGLSMGGQTGMWLAL